jgi:hypothetical protein
MAAPVIEVNDLVPSTVNPGGTATWTTVASDPDNTTESVHLVRDVRDAADNVTRFEKDMEIVTSDTLTYDAPTCEDPRVTLTVDDNDPTVVHVAVAAA